MVARGNFVAFCPVLAYKMSDGKAFSREKNDRLDLSVPVDLNFFSMGRQAIRLLEGNTAPYLIFGEMYFNVPGGERKTLPFSRDGRVSLRR